MKKIFCRIITIALVCSIMLSALCISASAASASIHFSDPSVTVGDSVTVNVSIGDAVAFYNVGLIYDSALLEYVSCSGSTGNFSGWGGGGSVALNDYATSGAGSFSCSITFKALKSGSAKISVASTDLVDTNGDKMEVSCGYSAVTINNPVTASSDSSLKELSISPGTLSPAFSAGTKSYTATVSSGTTSVVVSAIKNHSAASVSVSGGSSLSVGTNNVYITVTAEDGSQSTYTIAVTRPASTIAPPSNQNNPKPPEQEKPKEAYAVLATGETLKVADTIDPEVIPAGFTQTETTVESITVPAVTFGEKGTVYVYLEGKGDVPSGFYSINGETGFAYPMETFSRSEEKYIIIGTADLETPAGYKADKTTVGDKEYDVFVPETAGEYEHCLIYLLNDKGECWLYTYDPADGSLQRYGITGDIAAVEEPEPAPEPEPEPVPVPEPAPEPEKEQSFSEIVFGNKAVLWSAVGLVVLAAALAVVVIVLGVMYKRKSRACRLMTAARAHSDLGDIPDMPDISELPDIADIPSLSESTEE